MPVYWLWVMMRKDTRSEYNRFILIKSHVLYGNIVKRQWLWFVALRMAFIHVMHTVEILGDTDLAIGFSLFCISGRSKKKASTKERFWTWKLNSCDVTLKCTKGLISPLLISTSLSPTKAEHKYLSTSDWQFCLHTKKSWLKKECYQCYGMGISSNQWKWWDFLWCYFQSINEGGSKTLLG